MTDNRLANIEAKIDKLTEAMSSLMAIEEKVRSVNHRLGNVESLAAKITLVKDDINEKHSNTNIRLTAIETKMQAKDNSLATKLGHNATFVMFGILVTYVAKSMGLV